MSFINKYSTIIRFSNKEMLNIYSDNDIKFEYFDKNKNLLCSNSIPNSSYLDFTNSYFNLNSDDSVYGIYKNNSLNLVEIKNNGNEILKKEILNYDYKRFDILFPYVKILDNNIHILYYLYEKNSFNTCTLFHNYNKNNTWIKNKVDCIDHIILDNFKVFWIDNTPIVFYFKLINGYEEIFCSKFNSSTLDWSCPIQITNSSKNKLYLSILKDYKNFYHLTFCENINNGYAVKYINGDLKENKFDVNISSYASSPSTCRFPNLIKYKSDLYLTWVNHEKLYTCKSFDLGKTWSNPTIDNVSLNKNFTRANFLSNYKEDLNYNISDIFTISNKIDIIVY